MLRVVTFDCCSHGILENVVRSVRHVLLCVVRKTCTAFLFVHVETNAKAELPAHPQLSYRMKRVLIYMQTNKRTLYCRS